MRFVLRQCLSVDRKLTLCSNFVHVSHTIVPKTSIVIGMCVLYAVSAAGEGTVYVFEKVSDDFDARAETEETVEHGACNTV